MFFYYYFVSYLSHLKKIIGWFLRVFYTGYFAFVVDADKKVSTSGIGKAAKPFQVVIAPAFFPF
jgi:hypothetical protein